MCFPLPDLRLSIKELRRLKYVFHYLIQFRAFCQLVCFQIFFAFSGNSQFKTACRGYNTVYQNYFLNNEWEGIIDVDFSPCFCSLEEHQIANKNNNQMFPVKDILVFSKQ